MEKYCTLKIRKVYSIRVHFSDVLFAVLQAHYIES
jgi:hypothetical protein